MAFRLSFGKPWEAKDGNVYRYGYIHQGKGKPKRTLMIAKRWEKA